MHKLTRFAAIVACAAITPASQAAEVLITYTGTIARGNDDGGYFGAPATDMTGTAYTLRFRLDTLTSGADFLSGSNFLTIFGFQAENPIKLTEFTVNGVTQTWSNRGAVYSFGLSNRSDGFNGVDSVRTGSEDRTMFSGEADNWYAFNYVHSGVNDIISTFDLAAPLDYTLQPGDTWEGGYRFSHSDGNTFDRYSEGVLNPNRVTITAINAGPVPEPQTWAMLILGFSLVGAALRYRNREIVRV